MRVLERIPADTGWGEARRGEVLVISLAQRQTPTHAQIHSYGQFIQQLILKWISLDCGKKPRLNPGWQTEETRLMELNCAFQSPQMALKCWKIGKEKNIWRCIRERWLVGISRYLQWLTPNLDHSWKSKHMKLYLWPRSAFYEHKSPVTELIWRPPPPAVCVASFL